MRLKTYIVDNVPEAMSLIKKDLGSDALILNTKKIKTGGFLGLFKKDKIEVIAAAETKPLQLHEKQTTLLDLKERNQFNIQKTTAKPTNSNLNNNSSIDESSKLLTEISNLKKFMLQVIEDDRLPDVLKPVKKILKEQDLNSDIQSELLTNLMQWLSQNGNVTQENALQRTRIELLKLIQQHHQPVSSDSKEILCFVGPTGVGKTTTIAKIAADFILKENKSVGFITSDTYRIAAVEQLRTYANILSMPIQVVQNGNDFIHSINELEACDYILMDTAGRNYQQMEYIEELEGLIPDKNKLKIILVLSLTSKYEDMKRIIDNFKSINIEEILLTKQDETHSYGAIVNLMYDYNIPINYMTNGQNVPNDILQITPELLVEFLLGED